MRTLKLVKYYFFRYQLSINHDIIGAFIGFKNLFRQYYTKERTIINKECAHVFCLKFSQMYIKSIVLVDI